MLQRRNNYFAILSLILLTVLFCSAKNETLSTDKVFYQDLSLKKGEEIEIKIPGNIMTKKPGITAEKNTLLIDIENEVLSSGSTSTKDLIDVESQMYVDGKMIESVDVNDVIVNSKGKTFVFQKIVFDLCSFNKDSYVNLKIKAYDGSFSGYVSASFGDLGKYSIKCIEKDSEIFVPREQHGSCEGWDNKIWVFGGKQTVSKENVALNDLWVYGAIKNSWKSITPSRGTSPTPRFGHTLFCYFQYLIVFGGQSESGKPLGDLWVFDTFLEKWNFIMDTEDAHGAIHKTTEEFYPNARMFASGVSYHSKFSGFITGGLTSEGVACDIWELDFEKVLWNVENENQPLVNPWIYRSKMIQDHSLLCRHSHTTAIISGDEFVIYGGLDDKNEFVNTSASFSYKLSQVKQLTQQGSSPHPRVRYGVVSTNMGMVILFGGSSIDGRVYFSDLWHFIVKENNLIFKKIDSFNAGDASFITWRNGFTMHYIKGDQDPVLIGGGYGNNQQSRVLVTIPEQKCSNNEDLMKGVCSPCPYGSFYNLGQCKWCEHEEYFSKNECKSCPVGLVGSRFETCVPCPGGYIFDKNAETSCRKCKDELVCPMSTTVAFPRDYLEKKSEEMRLSYYPGLSNLQDAPFDYVSMIVLLLSLALSILLATLIIYFLSSYRERSLFVLREVDIPFLTGGKSKVIGGIIVIFYFLIVGLVVIGFLINFFLFNYKIAMSESEYSFMSKPNPSSFKFEVKLYSSIFTKENTNGAANNFVDVYKERTPDLCKENKIEVSYSRFFSQVEEKNKLFNCTKRSLGVGTDEYTLQVILFNIQDNPPNKEYVRFRVKSGFEQVFHFFTWEYWNIWSRNSSIPGSFSKIKGYSTPHTVGNSNKNITAAFRGPFINKVFFSLTPTKYGGDVEDENIEGYQVNYQTFIKGSVVSKRNIMNKNTNLKWKSEGITIDLISSTKSTLSTIEFQKSTTTIEFLAFIFGFPAGLALIAHALKYFLAKREYFRALDRECDAMFGRAETDDEKSIQLGKTDIFNKHPELKMIEGSQVRDIRGIKSDTS